MNSKRTIKIVSGKNFNATLTVVYPVDVIKHYEEFLMILLLVPRSDSA